MEPDTDTRPPNVIVILADDLGWRDTGVYGSTYYETPAIDGLAEEGMRFTDAYSANPLCSPTRASILTGEDPGRLRFTRALGNHPEEVLDPQVPESARADRKAVSPESRTRLPNEYRTYAEVLSEHGYTTAFMGKWHLGRAPYLPEQQGFDVVIGGRGNPGPPGGYFAPWTIGTLPDRPDGAHIDDALGDEAIQFIRENRERPFLLNLWFYSVHGPFQGKADLKEKYEATEDPQGLQDSPTMGAMVEVMDDNVGRILRALDELDLADDTIVIFTSDNGGNVHSSVDGTTPTNNAPLRAGKGNIHEGGIRVPLIVRWPARVQPGSVSEEIVSTNDFYPTILEMANLRLMPGQVLDGTSIVPALEGRSLDREALFTHFPHYTRRPGNLPSTAVRQGDWKLIRVYAEGPDQEDHLELYNLRDDVGETTNLAEDQPERAAAMNALIDEYLADTGALAPRPNPNYRP